MGAKGRGQIECRLGGISEQLYWRFRKGFTYVEGGRGDTGRTTFDGSVGRTS